MQTPHPAVDLARLRSIGWRLWDPIGLGLADGSTDEGCIDEYDRYLLHVVSLMLNGGSAQQAAAYLVEIAAVNMGLGARPSHQVTANRTAAAIWEYLVTVPGWPETPG